MPGNETGLESRDAAETSAGAPGLSRIAIRNALRLWTVEGCITAVQQALTGGGGFVTGFALYLGCGNQTIGVLGAIPSFANLFQLISSYFTQKQTRRKRLVTVFFVLGRLMYFPMALIPFVLPPNLWVTTFLVLVLCSELLLNVAAPVWLAWLSDLVPADLRGRYFGKRSMYASLVGMAAPIIGGAFLDNARKVHHGDQHAAFAVMFTVACVCALLSFVTAQFSPDVPPPAAEDEPDEGKAAGAVLAFYTAPFRDENYRRIMAFAACLAVAQTIAGPFWTVYQLKILGLNYTWWQVLAAVTGVSSMATMPLWGYLADKYGNKPMLAIACGMIVLPPLLWLFANPDGIPGLWMTDTHGHLKISYTKLDIIFLNLLAGAGWSGVNLTQFNLVIGASPADRRAVYISALSAVSGMVGAICPMLGGVLLDMFLRLQYPALGIVHSAYQVLFVISAAFRVVALFFLPAVSEAGSTSARYVLGQLRASKPIGSIRNIQGLSRSKSPQARQQAVENLAKLKTPVAVEELVRALDDPSLGVREQAANALGEIGDRRAVAPLLAKLSDPASAITDAAARALGKIGHLDALPALAAAAQLGPPQRQLAALEALGALQDPRVSAVLTSLIDSPEPSVRNAALRTLVTRADPVSLPALQSRLTHENDPAVLTMLADVLGRLDEASPEHLLGVLSKNESGVLRLAVLNAVGNLVGGQDAFYPFLSMDAAERDEAVTKILTQIQRRFRVSRESAARWPSARIAVLARQALRAYNQGDRRECIARLAQAGEVLGESRRLPAQATSALKSLRVLAHRAALPDVQVSADEVLLAVFLTRQITAV